MLYIFNDKFRKFLKGKGLCIIQTGHLVMHAQCFQGHR